MLPISFRNFYANCSFWSSDFICVSEAHLCLLTPQPKRSLRRLCFLLSVLLIVCKQIFLHCCNHTIIYHHISVAMDCACKLLKLWCTEVWSYWNFDRRQITQSSERTHQVPRTNMRKAYCILHLLTHEEAKSNIKPLKLKTIRTQ